MVYQAVAYFGIGRVFPFLKAANEVLAEKGIPLPLEGQATTTMGNRREAVHRHRSTSSATTIPEKVRSQTA